MSDVTFTPEQVREIRRRITDAYAHKRDILAAFPLPKVTRYRTFRFGDYDYRVNGCVVEFERTEGEGWFPTNYGNGTAEQFAAEMTRLRKWDVVAAFVDVCARPTEEVDA